VFADLRFFAILAAMLVYLPGCGVWYAVHPLSEFWRRAGPVAYGAFLIAVHLACGVVVIRFRESLVGPDLGFHWALLLAAVPLSALGLAFAVWRSREMGLLSLYGFGEVAAQADQPGRLRTAGIYNRIRHPRYIEAMLLLGGIVTFGNHLGGYLFWLLCLVLLAGVVRLEEAELTRRFGPAYSRYRRRVPGFFPRRKP
jgi:protein-S-isoprenylcysteine O-methyltransferase Ste14